VTDGDLCDALIDQDRRFITFGLLMSVNMLVETQVGFDPTPADWWARLAHGGVPAQLCPGPGRL
jgi:hypothetical protein